MPRPRKTADQHDLEGTRRKDREAGDPPEFKAEAPVPPPGLSKAARAHWDYIVPQLHAQRLLAKVHRGVLTSYCLAAVQVDRLAKVVDELEGEGGGYYVRDGLIKKHPAVGDLLDAIARLQQLANDLGMSPAAATSVSRIPDTGKGDPMAPTTRKARPAAHPVN